jgi:hypothetical protein
VTLVAVNIGDSAQVVPVGERAQSWVLQSANGSLDTKAIQINGHRPRADDAGELYGLEGAPVSGTISVPGKAIAFVKVTNAGNPNCR